MILSNTNVLAMNKEVAPRRMAKTERIKCQRSTSRCCKNDISFCSSIIRRKDIGIGKLLEKPFKQNLTLSLNQILVNQE